MKYLTILVLAIVVLASGCVGQYSSDTTSDTYDTQTPESPDTQTPESPGPQLPEEDLRSMAVAGDTVSLRECDPYPKVLKIAEGEKIKFQNPDTVQHRIFLEGDSYRIEGGSYLEIIAEFPYAREIYNYHCDDIQNAGYIIVE